MSEENTRSAPRLSKDEIDFILSADLPVRQKARELGRSPSTVLRVMAKYEDDGRKKALARENREKAKQAFVTRVLLEAFRLSRYPLEELVRAIEKVWIGPILPQSPALAGDRVPVHRLRRELKTEYDIHLYRKKGESAASGRSESRESESQSNVRRGRPETGIYAIHRVRVQWTNPEGQLCKADVLAVLERATGILVARAYSRLVPSGVSRTLLDAYSLTFLGVLKCVFVGVPSPSTKKLQKKSKGREKKIASPISSALGDTVSHLESLFEEKFGTKYQVEIEEPIGAGGERTLCLPWCFRDLFHLNRILQKWAAAYNCGKHDPKISSSAKRKERSPVEILFQYQDQMLDVEEEETLEEMKNRVFAYKRETRQRTPK